METNTSCAIPVRYLEAAIKCTPKKDIRFYLNGIYLDFPRGLIVATDGHKLFCGKLPDDCPQSLPAVIVPRDLAERAIKAHSKKERESYNLDVLIDSVDGQPPNVILATINGRFAASAIDGTFPEYMRVIPRSVSKETASYNPELLTDCQDALRAYSGLNKELIALDHNGTAAGLAHFGPDVSALCVVMPVRVEANGGDWPRLFAASESAAAAA
jgi:DNA polymerase III sliding clamp (beta) subunit (PCNA family)